MVLIGAIGAGGCSEAGKLSDLHAAGRVSIDIPL